jgi:hypothetical protein
MFLYFVVSFYDDTCLTVLKMIAQIFVAVSSLLSQILSSEHLSKNPASFFFH